MSHCAEPTATRCHPGHNSTCPCKAAVVAETGSEKRPATDRDVLASVTRDVDVAAVTWGRGR